MQASGGRNSQPRASNVNKSATPNNSSSQQQATSTSRMTQGLATSQCAEMSNLPAGGCQTSSLTNVAQTVVDNKAGSAEQIKPDLTPIEERNVIDPNREPPRANQLYEDAVEFISNLPAAHDDISQGFSVGQISWLFTDFDQGGIKYFPVIMDSQQSVNCSYHQMTKISDTNLGLVCKCMFLCSFLLVGHTFQWSNWYIYII